MAEQLDSPAPLPEDPADALLTKMLTPAPYEVPEKTKKKVAGTRKGLRRKVVSESLDNDSNAHSSHGKEEEEKSSPPSQGRQEKEGRPIRGGQRVQEGKDPPSDCAMTAADSGDEWLPRDKPLEKS